MLADERLLGVTHFEPSSSGNDPLATGINSSMFFKRYFEPFGINP
jgi:hypothetical protein